MYKTLNAPLAAHVEVNTFCNQRCRHCYNFWRASDPGLDIKLSPELTVRIADQLAQHGVFHVILNGGEPLMNVDGLLSLMGELRARGITFSLNSTLALIKPETARQLKEAGLNTVLASLLSYNPDTHNYLTSHPGSFQKVTRGVGIAIEAGLRVALNMVVSRRNLGHIEKTGLLAKELGASFFSATRVIPPRLAYLEPDSELILRPDEIRAIVESLVRLQETGLVLDSLIPYPGCFFDTSEEVDLLGMRSCSAGKTSVAIGADGLVRACPHHEKTYGSIMDKDLASIWQRMHEWRDGSILPEACLSCRFIAQCGGGCRVAPTDGSLCGEDPIMKKSEVRKLPTLVRHHDAVLIEGSTLMKIRKGCRFRQDDEVGIINTGGIKNAIVERETLELLKSLHAEGVEFTPGGLRDQHGIQMSDEEYYSFMSELVTREVAQISTG
ncbi:MAG: Radical SAM domain protein [Candidatus Nomurabacteria bacterium GW2011_GWA1_46_11]|uniref:Radical SAM core domain-containing protein n=2 Tax=Parcubacteria group TaxID=1794811 RepID=A0A1G1YVV9_9BACT|nr:MAG: Radical SAM domain protein [Parcubacteria group bacterium GW2011_GWA2_46_10]KKU22203.1 MAG: Radical SAM domain protein [Candidatus Nomurabacteria bacterium GW2011_GWA1_46_11]OGY56502.1 MAG: hypothetical protein A2119_00220 [Candidatus Colwellbacteria bacterium GWA2_46_10]